MEGEEPLVFNVEGRQQVGQDEDYSFKEAYKSYVDSMRAIGDWTPTKSSSSTEEPFFDVILNTSRHMIRLRLSRWDFRIMGYQMEGCSSSSDGKWVEFGHDDEPRRWKLRFMDRTKHWILGSVFMELEYDYADLEDKLEGGGKFCDIPLGQHDLVDAVNTLAVTEEREEREKSLIVVSLMVCEGSKFPDLFNHLAEKFSSSLPLPPELVSLARKFQLYPLKDLPHVHHPGYSSQPSMAESGLLDFPPLEVDSIFDEVVGGEGQQIYTFDGTYGGNTSGVDLDMGKGEQVPALSGLPATHPRDRRPLAQVFFLRIDELMGDMSGQFYGTIIAESNSGKDIIYNRMEEEAEDVEIGDIILLAGPRQCMAAFSRLEFHFGLMGETMCPYGGQLRWDRDSKYVESEYNKVVVEDFDGKFCTVSLCYIAYDDAVEAVIGVEVIGNNVGDLGQLWGEIAAICGKFNRESLLFRKKMTNSVKAHRDQPLHLSRSIVSVPCGSTLIVRTKLYISDEALVDGTAEFSAQFGGTSAKDIPACGGSVCVRITWQ